MHRLEGKRLDLSQVIDDQHKERIDIEEVSRGFLEVAKSALAKLMDVVLADSAFADLQRKLYASDDWAAGRTTATWIATLADYLSDVSTFLEPGKDLDHSQRGFMLHAAGERNLHTECQLLHA